MKEENFAREGGLTISLFYGVLVKGALSKEGAFSNNYSLSKVLD